MASELKWSTLLRRELSPTSDGLGPTGYAREDGPRFLGWAHNQVTWGE
jgi:hypothetical protein